MKKLKEYCNKFDEELKTSYFVLKGLDLQPADCSTVRTLMAKGSLNLSSHKLGYILYFIEVALIGTDFQSDMLRLTILNCWSSNFVNISFLCPQLKKLVGHIAFGLMHAISRACWGFKISYMDSSWKNS